jgi:pyrroloquinoline-quinone synthase
MNNATILRNDLQAYDLLQHEFYQYWNHGLLNIDTLREYAKQYFWHVSSFPQSLSALHSICPSLKMRKIILENLVDEEYNEPNHPQLWLEFAQGLGITEQDVQSSIPNKYTQNLLDTFKATCTTEYEQGLGALFAHEWQYSKIAETKEEGLKKHYGVKNQKALEFFTVHSKVDVWHAQQLEELLNNIPSTQLEKVRQGAIKAAKALWQFLDGMLEYHNQPQAA